jgi:pilus assembly protein CpaB
VDRQKIALIFVTAWVSAALLTWFLYATTKAPHAEKMVTITAAAHDMPAGTRLVTSDLKTIRVPEKDVPKAAILDQKLAIDRPLLFPVSANEAISSNKIANAAGAEGLPSLIEVGKRAVSVPVTDGSGVAGMIQPRAHVDVLFTKPGSNAEAVTTTILEDIVVLAMGRTTEVTTTSASTTATANAAPRPTTQAATLLVTPEQARKLELAKNQGKISLALRNPLDHTSAKDQSATTSDQLYAGFHPKTQNTPNLRDDRVWNQLIAKPPEKKEPAPPPRHVIDVYRGDKHVQEIFQ